MNTSKLSEINYQRCMEWHKDKPWSLSDWATAVTGELGEACNVIKKLNRIRDGINQNQKSEQELRKELAFELADTFLYLDLLAANADIDLWGAVREKFNIVSEQYGFEQRL